MLGSILLNLGSLRTAPSQKPVMSWDSLSLTLGSTPILDGVTIEAQAGRLLGVIGPSGAGKTSLLDVLGGRSPCSHSKTLSGVTSKSVPDAASIAVLDQNEQFFGLLTVRETLEFVIQLEADRHVMSDPSTPFAGGGDSPKLRRESTISGLLRDLGLEKVQHSRVGDAHHRGISGGEKRRLAVGCALLANPKLLIADEPTSGLDGYQAQRVVALLRHTARTRAIPAVATLHQPRSSIWATLDDVVLLAHGGRVVYRGPREAAMAHFAALGYPCPSHVNPAEHLIDLVSLDTSDEEARRKDEQRVQVLCRAWAKAERGLQKQREPSTSSAAAVPPELDEVQGRSPPSRPNRLRRLQLLLQRSWRQTVRDGWINGIRLGVSTGLALVFGEIFGRLGAPTAASVAERIARTHARGGLKLARTRACMPRAPPRSSTAPRF
jgi:ABC-type multidrug transport system ATPase subunit